MHKPESVLKNSTNKILWDFKIQMDHQILVRLNPDLMLIQQEKRTCH